MYIGKAAQRSGTTVKTIRYYEEIGLLLPPERQGEYRVYNQQSVELLTSIKCAQQLGFKLKEMQAILQGHRGEGFAVGVGGQGHCRQEAGSDGADQWVAADMRRA